MQIVNKVLILLLATASVFTVSCNQKTADESDTASDTAKVATEVEEKPVIASPRKQAAGQIGDVNVVIDYGSPGVKGRKIWGGLESYGAVWRAGANETTSIEFSQDVTIGDKTVPAGKYGFYIIPKENENWVAVINTDWNREKHGAWGAYNYTPDHDIVRVEVSPEWVEESEERLKYVVSENAIHFAWEKVRLTIPVEPTEQ
ncbi:hypothetical protein C900_02655 [Fulvivirga imtechensis AK7]|uniref:DUF2911 domain-containing protein n=1 Tax=Fulvivirga imtechensis AK7 TaxID=1237149 RepID=L8JXR3_9BACT|nr:DUF2911 domain-containing protein [Fulvivirga imtechensis]ELR73570.1 hypothetical protein C900_02655 [Fulvivirga imtechensis AK7]